MSKALSRDPVVGILKRLEEGLNEGRSEVRTDIAIRLKTLEWLNSETVTATGLTGADLLQIE